MPRDITDLNLKVKGDTKVMHSGNMVCAKIMDRKQVMLLSTAHTMEKIPTGKRNAQGNEITRHEIIHKYNKNMGAVDVFHQMLSYSSFNRRSLKWYKKVHFFVFSIAILNAHLLYKFWMMERRKTPKLQREFRAGFAKQLVASCERLPKTT